MEILELLRDREIVHPSRLVSALIAEGELQLIVEGYPWWIAADRPVEGRIVLRFSGIGSGDLNLPGMLSTDDDEVLEEFEVRLTSDLPWAQPESASIYCSAPLPSPISMFTAVQDFLLTSNAARKPDAFLNGADRLGRFIELTSAAGYLLARGPDCIWQIVIAELEAQSVPHSIVQGRGHPERRLFVRIAGSAFFCEAATADFS